MGASEKRARAKADPANLLAKLADPDFRARFNGMRAVAFSEGPPRSIVFTVPEQEPAAVEIGEDRGSMNDNKDHKDRTIPPKHADHVTDERLAYLALPDTLCCISDENQMIVRELIRARTVIAALPKCGQGCSATATSVTRSGGRACDAHLAIDTWSVDLPYADAVRALEKR